MNGIPMINGTIYNWGDITTTIGGVPILGITAIEYNEDQEMENFYGAGRYPIARGKGRITATAKVTLTIEETRAIAANAPNGRLQDIDPFDITVSYIPPDAAKVHTDTVKNCQFKSNSRNWAEGDTSKTVEFELIVSHVIYG